jgi:chromosome segregation ATPase
MEDILQAIQALGARFDAKFDELDAKLDGMNTKFKELDSKLDGMNTKFKELDSKFDGLNTKFKELDSKFDGLSTKFKELDTKVMDNAKNISALIEDSSASLQREMEGLSSKVHSVDARVGLHGGLIRGGAMQITRLIAFTETLEAERAATAIRLADMEARIASLESAP